MIFKELSANETVQCHVQFKLSAHKTVQFYVQFQLSANETVQSHVQFSRPIIVIWYLQRRFYTKFNVLNQRQYLSTMQFFRWLTGVLFHFSASHRHDTRPIRGVACGGRVYPLAKNGENVVVE